MPNYIEKSTAILNLLRSEHILNPENAQNIFNKLNILRTVCYEQSQKNNYMAPGFTGLTACTLMKVGACQELTHRFILEYSIQNKEADINCLILGNPDDPSKNNHAIVLVGSICCDDALFFGRTVESSCLPNSKNYVPLHRFLGQQDSDVAIVDPLLDTISLPSKALELRNYCKKYNITHVLGIRQYSSSFLSNAVYIKTNAVALATELTQQFWNNCFLAITNNDTAASLNALDIIRNDNRLLDNPDDSGMTMLHYACLYGNEVVANLLIEYGASVNVINKEKHTPIDCLGYTKPLISKALTPIGKSSHQSNMSALIALKMTLLSKGHHSAWLLRKEAMDGNIDVVKLLLKNSLMHLNTVGMPSGRSALHQAAANGRTLVCDYLVSQGAILDAADSQENTPLLLAVIKGHWETAKKLIGFGADINHSNTVGQTAKMLLEEHKQAAILEIITPLVSNSPASPLIEGSLFAPLAAADTGGDMPSAHLSSPFI